MPRVPEVDGAAQSVPVITIDGPAGVGKGTASLGLAQFLCWHYLDSGALYRVLALASLERRIAVDDVARLTALASSLGVSFRIDKDAAGEAMARVFLGGLPVGTQLRAEACAARASQIAALPAVRDALLQLQRSFRKPPGLVAEGRDMGTVVFPDAQLKVFITASVEVRAERRFKQLKQKGLDGSLRALLDELTQRDRRDRERSVSPLRPAADAVVIDTSDLGIVGVQDRLRSLCLERGLTPCISR